MSITPSDLAGFADEMDRWSRSLHDLNWIAVQYDPTLSALLGQPSMSCGEADGWNAAGRLVAAFVEPLSEYTSGWTETFREVRPRMRSSTGRELLAMARLVGRRIHSDIVESGLTESPDELQGFICDQHALSARHICLALREYTSRVRAYLEGMAIVADVADGKVCDTLTQHYFELAALYGQRCANDDSPAPPVPSTPQTGQRRQPRSSAISTDRLDGWPSILGDLSVDDIERSLLDDRVKDFARIRISRDPTQRRDDESLWWEAELVMHMLADPQPPTTGFVATVTSAWGRQRPEHARAIGLDDALRDVELLIRTAVNYARRLAEGLG